MPRRRKSRHDIADAAPVPQPKRVDGPPPPGFKLRHTLRGHTDRINRIAWSPLANAGIDVILDRNDNAQIGASVARFISEIERSDYVAVVRTPLYRQKYENKLSSTGSVVAAEVDLINLRLIATEEQKNTVLPLLLAGEEAAALPPLARLGIRRFPRRFIILRGVIRPDPDALSHSRRSFGGRRPV